MTSLWCLYCYLCTDFTHCSGDSIVDFEQVNASSDKTDTSKKWHMNEKGRQQKQ